MRRRKHFLILTEGFVAVLCMVSLLLWALLGADRFLYLTWGLASILFILRVVRPGQPKRQIFNRWKRY